MGGQAVTVDVAPTTVVKSTGTGTFGLVCVGEHTTAVGTSTVSEPMTATEVTVTPAR